jgi:hypothetical protein
MDVKWKTPTVFEKSSLSIPKNSDERLNFNPTTTALTLGSGKGLGTA